MDNLDKDYVLHEAMVSMAAFRKAGELANRKIMGLSQSKVSAIKALEHLSEFMIKESDRVFDLYENSLKK